MNIFPTTTTGIDVNGNGNDVNVNVNGSNVNNNNNIKKKDLDVNEILNSNIGQILKIPAFKYRDRNGLCEFGGKLKYGGVAAIVCNKSFEPKVGFTVKHPRPRGKVFISHVGVGDKYVIVKESKNRFGSLMTTVILSVVDIEKNKVVVKVNHKYTGKAFPNELPINLKATIVEKLESNNTNIMYGKYFHTLNMEMFTIDENILVPTTKGRKLKSEHHLKGALLNNWPAVAIIQYDELTERIYYKICSVDFKTKIIEEVKDIFVVNLNEKRVFNSRYKQHLFNSKDITSFRLVWDKIKSKETKYNIVLQTVR